MFFYEEKFYPQFLYFSILISFFNFFFTIAFNSFIFINIIIYTMKNICDWNNCKEVGEYKAPIEKDNSKNIVCCVWNM